MIRSSNGISPWVRAWLAWSAFCALATGILSVPGWLNGWGWSAAVVCFLLVATRVGWIHWRKPDIRWRRYRRGLPAMFAAIVAIAFVGACVYAPTNIDTLWYRLPRVIQWLQAGRWHWLDTERWRLNSIAFGLELHWLPLAAWKLPTRALAFPNLVSFLLLPGLLFRVFRQLGVASVAARGAMWVVASGWCFISQAGSTATDAYAAVYFLAAIDAALAFSRSPKFETLGWSVIAAALLTNTKQTNLPLLLPWLVALWPGRGSILNYLRLAPARTLGIAIIAFLISTGPLIVANWIHTGSWAGTPAWANERWRPVHPWFALVIQLPFLFLQNLQPPITPGVDAWNSMVKNWVEGPIAPWFQGFDLPGRLFSQIGEHCAGLGLAPLLWVVATIFGAVLSRRVRRRAVDRRIGYSLAVATWVGAAVVLSRIGFLELARYFAAYYPLLLLPVLLPAGVEQLARKSWWRMTNVLVLGAGIVFAATLRHRPIACPPALLQSPPLGRIGVLHRLGDALEFQTNFDRQLGEFAKLLPAGEPLGWAHDYPGEAEFGWPPRSRRIQLFPPDVDSKTISAARIRWVVTSAKTATDQAAELQKWASDRGGVIRATIPFVERFGQPTNLYALVEFPVAQKN